MAKIYITLQLNYIKLEIEKILRKNQNGFPRNWSTTLQILTICWILGVCAKNREATLICRFLQGIWPHTLREDGANTSSLWSLQRNCHSYNDALYKHESKSSLTGWRHRLLWHCCWCSARGYISPISAHNLLKLYTLNIDRSNERKLFYTKKGKKQMIPCTNYHGHRLHTTSGKYIYPGWIPAT